MSTKIYNAYRVDTPLQELFSFHRSLIALVEETYEDLYLALAVTIAVSSLDALLLPDSSGSAIVDDATLTPPSPVPMPLWSATRIIDTIAQNIATSKRRAPGLDLACELVYLSDPSDPTCFYLKVIAEDPAYSKKISELPGLIDFSFWNNTDRPSELSETEWNVRAEIWERVLPGYSSPAQCGLLYSTDYIIPPTYAAMTNRSDLTHLIPSRQDRARGRGLNPEALTPITSGDLFDPTALLATLTP